MRFVLALSSVALACGCGGISGKTSNATWTEVQPLDTSVAQAGKATGFWFDSTMNGDVTFDTGLIEHFNAPTTIDKIALDGHGKAAGPSDDTYFGFLPDPTLGLVAISASSADLVTSSDHGASFQYGKMYGQFVAPQGIPLSFPLLYVGKDPAGTWHLADTQGGVWSSPTAPGPSANFTVTWHPVGDVTVPNMIPQGDCAMYVVNGYYALDPGHMFAVTPDGKTMMYGGKDAICRSTDGGNNFVDVTNNIMPAGFNNINTPWIALFSSNTVGILAFGSDLSGPGSSYVLYTSDGGANWTEATLPTSGARNSIDLTAAFASPGGAMFLVGAVEDQNANLTPLVYKSSDGGKTWTDLSDKFAGLSNLPFRLASGFALDDQHIWVGGENGFIAYSSTGGQ